MKRLSILLFVLSAVLFGFTIVEKINKSVIPERRVMQIGIIVKDVEASSKAWAKFLGQEELPEIKMSGNSERQPTTFKGIPSDAKVKMAFFKFDNIMLELLEPVGDSSTWNEFLQTNGPGLHHIAFNVSDMDERIKECEENGISLLQRGGWNTGEYSYLEAKEMGLILELLENYNKK